MKILILTQYFWPENFRINELSEELVKLGHEITVLTGYPNYPEGEISKDFLNNKKKFNEYKGTKIIRVPILARGKGRFKLTLNYLSFLFNSILIGYFKLYKKDFDLIFTFQVSPITIGITSAFFSSIKNCPSVFWVLDLWPDTLVALNIIKKKWQIKFFKFFVNWIYSRCDIILAQSKNLLYEIRKYPSVRRNAFYFPSWGEHNLFKKDIKPAKEVLETDKFTILFAGNIGKAQDFPNILKSVIELKNKKVDNFRILIIGEGSEKDWLIKQIKEYELQDYFEIHKGDAFEKMPSYFLHADALLVSLLNKEVFNKTIPGKVQFYLSSGIPIIGMLGGEGAEVIRKSNSGFLCESGEYIKLSKIIKKITLMNKKDLKKLGQNGIDFSKKEFLKSKLIKKLEKIFLNAKNQKTIHTDKNLKI